MKKLMIAAAIVCAAAMSQAAMVDWYQSWEIGTKSFKMSDNTTKPNGTTVYLMDTQAATWSALTTILTDGGDYANLAAVLAGDEFAGAKVDQATTYYSDTAAKVNNFYGEVKNGKASFGKADETDPAKQSYYAILVTDGEKYLISGKEEGISWWDDVNDGTTAKFTGVSFTTDAGATGWQTYTSAVPEPTSGLLLLLGVAGLALRRRRA